MGAAICQEESASLSLCRGRALLVLLGCVVQKHKRHPGAAKPLLLSLSLSGAAKHVVPMLLLPSQTCPHSILVTGAISADPERLRCVTVTNEKFMELC